MSLAPGQSLANFRLVARIGEGGMGVVWKATDTTLSRDVAIKILPDLLASDPERLARFEREARLLASLNHPRIASIFGLHTADGVRFLAMELVEGEDLAERLARGAVPVPETLAIALEVAHALEHAHERGVMHRDLKPANVMLTGEGGVKVLDFGLAKALEGDPGRPTSSLSQSPTITGALTGANVLLGTAAYMAPEQARGQAADKRADVWAFGVLVTEMLTGRRLFQGETISDTLASVLKSEPDWSALPKDTPPGVLRILRRCLERDPRRRLRDIGEARFVLEEILGGRVEEPAVRTPVVPSGRSRLSAAALGVAGLLLGIVATLTLTRGGSPPANGPLVKFHLAPPEGDAVPTSSAISPDGKMVAYLIRDRLWIQTLGELEPREIRLETGASHLFWSPDARHVGYFAGQRVMKVAVSGGEKQAICDVRAAPAGGHGGSWREDGWVVFSRGDTAGLFEVSALGGDPRVLLPTDTTETDFHEPYALPGGRGVLFAAHRRSGIDNISLLAGGKRKVLLELPGQFVSHPVYSSTGHILFRRSPTTPGIWALPFSLSRLEVTGEAFLVAPEGARPSVSRGGTLAYAGAGGTASTQLIWVDRQGEEQGTIGEAELSGSWDPSLSPDGRRVARSSSEGEGSDIWIHDTARGTRTRLTFDPGPEGAPSWSPAGDRIVYHASARGCATAECFSVLVRPANGSGSPDTLARMAVFPYLTPDGRHLTYTGLRNAGSTWDIMAVPLEGERKPFPVVRGNPRAFAGRVSPAGNVLAYVSGESGQNEVYVTRFPSGEGRWQVSVAGGEWPVWGARGDRLYFVKGDDIMEVEVSREDSPVLGRPHRVLSRPPLGTGAFGWHSAFDVAPDGSRFVVLRTTAEKGRAPAVTVVQNWVAEFAARK